MIRVGVDAGGTFTDVVVLDDVSGAQRELKLPSRRDDPAAVVLEALTQLGLREQPLGLVFSTTAATNAILERRGGPTVLFTTAGFEDVLEIGRQARPELYALEPRKPAPLVAAVQRHGVNERMSFDGQALEPLTDDEIERVCALVTDRSTTVAVSFLHGHAHPAHESRLVTRLRALGFTVSASSEVCPLPREYERTSTTVVDAYVTPVLGSTLAKLKSTSIALRVMESSGGARAGVRPARTVLSGPAAGVIAAEALARRMGVACAVALDMGGTSTDLALIEDGVAARVDELTVDGVPIALPSIAVRTVGAGGGSIAWLDAGGALKVGPRSAGALPGPAAYGRGGSEPTVTDAHVVLGRLGDSICGGTVKLDRALAGAALQPLAEALATSIEDVAHAIIAVTDATVARAVRATALGRAPERSALISYGGASGLHVVGLARALGFARVLVPPAPGLQCALGTLQADVVIEALATRHERLGANISTMLRGELAALSMRVGQALEAEGVPSSRRRVLQFVRARYVGQGVDAELELSVDDCTLDRETFERAHEKAYGYRLARDIELVRLSVRGIGTAKPVAATPRRTVGWSRIASRRVDGVPTARYRRDRLPAGTVIEGPALIEEMSATLWIPAGCDAEVLPDGTIEC